MRLRLPSAATPENGVPDVEEVSPFYSNVILRDTREHFEDYITEFHPVVNMIDLAGLTICGFVVAVFTWYGSLRNGMQTVYDDVNAAKNFDTDLNLLLKKIESKLADLDNWKTDWLLSDDTPLLMLVKFWGEKDLQYIEALVKNMARKCNEAERKLKKLLTIDTGKLQKMNNLRKKAYFVGVKSKYLRDIVDSLSADLSDIKSASQRGWQRYEYLRQETIDYGKVYHTGVGYLLVSVAMRLKNDADALHRSCQSVGQNTKIEMDLDIFDASHTLSLPPESRPELSKSFSRTSHAAEIAKAEKNGRLNWRVRGQDSTLGDTGLRMQIQKAEKLEEDIRPLIPAHAFGQITRGTAQKSHFALEGFYYCISAGDQTGWTPETRNTLRSLFSHCSPPTFTSENLLGKLSKFRLAFELSQACLLLVRTTWFPRICSCHVQCTSSNIPSTPLNPILNDQKYEFGIEMASVDHVSPTWATKKLGTCWGVAAYQWNDLTRPIRRVGLLLVEIVLGCPILKIETDALGIVQALVFVHTNPSNLALNERRDNLGDVLRRVRDAFSGSRSAQEAIRFCLTVVCREAPTDEEMRGLLTQFYTQVIQPCDYPLMFISHKS